MKIKPAISAAGLGLCIVVGAVQLGGCSSTPKPAEADGSSRVPANDPTRVQALQERVNADRQLLSQNNLLRAQVEVLQSKLNEMTTILRDALTLPPVPRPQPAPTAVPPAAHAVPQSMTAPSTPAYAYTTNSSGVVIRVPFKFAKSDFEPSEQVAEALRASLHGAEQIEVRGHTDSNVINPIDKLIAIERAERARIWLINNGAEAAKIRTKYFSAGNFLMENRTPEGRSMNRRVEIDIHNQQLAGDSMASNM